MGIGRTIKKAVKTVTRPAEKLFRTGSSSAARNAMQQAQEQTRLQEQRMKEEQRRFEEEQRKRQAELERQRREAEERQRAAQLQADLMSDLASRREDDTPDIELGVDLDDLGGGGKRKRRKRNVEVGASSLGIR